MGEGFRDEPRRWELECSPARVTSPEGRVRTGTIVPIRPLIPRVDRAASIHPCDRALLQGRHHLPELCLKKRQPGAIAFPCDLMTSFRTIPLLTSTPAATCRTFFAIQTSLVR